MRDVLKQLYDIEQAACSLLNRAEEKKKVLQDEYRKKAADFDAQLEKEQEEKLQTIRKELEKQIEKELEDQKIATEKALQNLDKDYESNHTRFAKELMNKVLEA